MKPTRHDTGRIRYDLTGRQDGAVTVATDPSGSECVTVTMGPGFRRQFALAYRALATRRGWLQYDAEGELC